MKKYVQHYMDLLERNEKEIHARLEKLTELHIDRIEGIDADDREHLLNDKTKFKVVLEYYRQATDKDNPERGAIDIDDSMNGRMIGSVQSYDLMANPKYRRIDRLLFYMRETFGYNEEIAGFVMGSINEADFLLAKKSVDLQRLMSTAENQQISELVRHMMARPQGFDDNDSSVLTPLNVEGPPSIELDNPPDAASNTGRRS